MESLPEFRKAKSLFLVLTDVNDMNMKNRDAACDVKQCDGCGYMERTRISIPWGKNATASFS